MRLASDTDRNMCTKSPLQISHADLAPEMWPFRDALTECWVSKEHALTKDIYPGTMAGLTHCLDTVYKGIRPGSFLFLNDKSNITVLASVQSKKLIIDPTTKVCTCVIVINTTTGEELILNVKYEVIVSQGDWQSIKLLKKHNISVIVDSSHLGQHLLDHPIVPFVLRLKDGYGLDDHLYTLDQPMTAPSLLTERTNWPI